MRICYIADAGYIHTQRWVNYFAQRGHEIHLISTRLGDGYIEGVKFHLLTMVAPKIWALSKYLNAVLWLIQARRLVRIIRPDVLDAHYITIEGYLAVASGFHPLVLTAWGSDILIDPKQNILWKILTKYSLKKADLMICDSEAVNNGLIKLGSDSSKTRVIFHGVDTQRFSPQQRDGALRNMLNISNSPTIISIRNLSPIYDVETLINAIPLVLSQAPVAKFIIGGDGKQKGYLEDVANRLGVSENVNFIGWIPHNEIPKYTASSDIYVSTSLSDSASVSLQEAMACGLAPVVTDLPACREWVTDGENGFIVPTRDAPALADRIVYLLRNKEVRRRFGETGRKIIKERAEFEKEMAKMERLYEELLYSKKEP